MTKLEEIRFFRECQRMLQISNHLMSIQVRFCPHKDISCHQCRKIMRLS